MVELGEQEEEVMYPEPKYVEEYWSLTVMESIVVFTSLEPLWPCILVACCWRRDTSFDVP